MGLRGRNYSRNGSSPLLSFPCWSILAQTGSFFGPTGEAESLLSSIFPLKFLVFHKNCGLFVDSQLSGREILQHIKTSFLPTWLSCKLFTPRPAGGSSKGVGQSDGLTDPTPSNIYSEAMDLRKRFVTAAGAACLYALPGAITSEKATSSANHVFNGLLPSFPNSSSCSSRRNTG